MDAKKIELIKKVWNEHKYRENKPRSIVLKLGTNCNLRCDYCYVEHKKKDESLDIGIVEKLFDELMLDNNNCIDCCFHGGEPFFYFNKMKEIIELLSLKPYSNQIRYSCQSNGTLLSDEIIEYIKKEKIAIGISIDGPKEVNDMFRKYKNGLGSFNDIINGIHKLQKNHIGFSVLSVLTNENSGYIIETLSFLKSIGINSVDLKPCFKSSLNQNSLEVEKYANLMIDVIEWMIKNNSDESKLLVREVEMYTNLIMKQKHKTGWYECRSMCDLLNCGAGRDHITVDIDGSIYICDRLYGHNDFILGNIRNENLKEIMNNNLIKEFLNRKISEIDECCDCDLNKICFLGCPATSILLSNGNINAIHKRPEYCMYFMKIITRLGEEVEKNNYKKLIHVNDV